MKPIQFKEQNAIIEGREVSPLPAHQTQDGRVVSCWKLTFTDKMKVLLLGKVWIQTLTYGQPLQPVSASIETPFEKE